MLHLFLNNPVSPKKTPFFFYVLLFCLVGIPKTAHSKETTIRVALKLSAKKVHLSSLKKIIVSGKNNKILLSARQKKITVSAFGGNLLLNNTKTEKILRVSSRNNLLSVNGATYRGIIEIHRVKKGLLLINELDVESYIQGVLSNEVPSSWGMEALKAQAIVARTYALYQKARHNDDDLFHLKSTVADQVYNGKKSEQKRTTQAVKKTTGLVLVFKNTLALSVYHSTCGGHTEKAENVWDGTSAPYLQGRKCDFDKQSPRYNWSFTLSLSKLQKLLQKQGIGIGTITAITPLILTESGRIFRLKITHSKGKKVLKGNDFRKIIGWDKVRSTSFSVKIKGGQAFFSGKGSGHGVGLCQWGAKGMADQGNSYKQILSYYYPGTQIKRFFRRYFPKLL